MNWDYIIVGAGAAGCVLANRLSEDPGRRVLLLEAGPSDKSPYIHIPKGFAKTLVDPRHAWFYPIEPAFAGAARETWVRGRALGGSSAVNGMMYVRGHPADYDGWAAKGATGWGWPEMLASFRAMEDHGLGANEWRGGGGPLHITARPPERLAAWEALIAAGEEAGLPLREDLNEEPGPGIGYLPATIRKGLRWSAARAFLEPIRRRPNLRIETGATVSRILLEGRRAIGVRVSRPDDSHVDHTGSEIILSAGAIASPMLLQLSGIGPADHLASLGIDIVADNPGVGANLLEHRLLGFQFRIRQGGYNRGLRGIGLALSIARYLALRTGPLSTGAYQIGAFIKTRPELDRPDSELLMGAYSVDLQGSGLTMEREPGLRIISFAMRPRSQGSLRIRSANAGDPPIIHANFLSDAYDQRVSVASARFIRRMAAQPSLAKLIVSEMAPGPAAESDEDIIQAYRQSGIAGQHASSTCRMGTDARAVVDPQLRVRGIGGLSVMDCSVMPSMVSGNTNGPVMAMAWNAADIIRRRSHG